MALSNMVNVPTEIIPVDAEESSASVALTVVSDQVQFDMSELALPRLKLLQGMSDEVKHGVATPGNWFMEGIPASKTIQVTLTAMGRRRDYMNSDMTNPVSFCRSDDSVVGNPTGDGVAQHLFADDAPRACAGCPFQEWTEKDGKRVKPACTFKYVYQGYTISDGAQIPFTLTLQRTAIKAVAKTINTYIATRGLGRFTIELGSNLSKGGYFEPTVKIVAYKPLTELV